MKYRKLPVVIDAFQWTGELNNADEWFIDALASGKAMFEGGELKIVTLEGVMAVSKSDYIIRGVAGEIYPCKPTIFYRTYTLDTISGGGEVKPEDRKRLKQHIEMVVEHKCPIEDELRSELEKRTAELHYANIACMEMKHELDRLNAELLELNNEAVFIKFENEDELPAEIKDDVYSAMFECSHVDGVRLHPYIEENGQKYFLVMLKEDV